MCIIMHMHAGGARSLSFLYYFPLVASLLSLSLDSPLMHARSPHISKLATAHANFSNNSFIKLSRALLFQ
jgi:hypothetical protein